MLLVLIYGLLRLLYLWVVSQTTDRVVGEERKAWDVAALESPSCFAADTVHSIPGMWLHWVATVAVDTGAAAGVVQLCDGFPMLATRLSLTIGAAAVAVVVEEEQLKVEADMMAAIAGTGIEGAEEGTEMDNQAVAI